MRINLCILGTRGDIQPAIALGLGLKNAGHAVKLVSFGDFASLVRSYGLDFCPVRADLAESTRRFSRAALFDSGAMAVRFIPEVIRAFRGMVEGLTRDFWETGQNADLIIGGPASNWMAGAAAEKLGISYIDSCVQPLAATRQFPTIFWPSQPAAFSGRGLKGAFNLFTYGFVQQLTWIALRGLVNRCRVKVLGLSALRFDGNACWPQRFSQLVLAGFSELVVPRPPEWDPKIHITGFWFLDTPNYTPPAALQAFLEAGPPPVYIGFGSMPSKDPSSLAALAVSALHMAGQRGVIHTGRGVLGQGMAGKGDTGDIFHLDSAPHDWLFPRMAAVVHHGGSGTTAAGLRAGVPSILIPAATDQLLWAQRVAALGLGPKPILRPRLNAGRLVEAIIRATRDSSLRSRTVTFGEKIRAEDGVARAVEIVNKKY